MRFSLAPMDALLRWMTTGLWLLPLLFAGFAAHAPEPVATIMAGAGVFIVVLFTGIGLWMRPTRFEVDETTLEIVWPLRRRSIPRATITGVRRLTAAEFRSEYGYGMRFGAGGLWGGFGLLKTVRETFELWVSRTDAFVLVERAKGSRSLLITPERPEDFIAALTRA